MSCLLHVAGEPVHFPWYALRTKSNFEHTAATVLETKGFECYLPKYTSRRRWSDRTVLTSLPLFPGYVFCRFDPKSTRPILSAPGVVSIIGFGNEPAEIAEYEIDVVRRVLRSARDAEPCPFLREGQHVRIRTGALEGIEGILTTNKSDWRIVVSVTLLQRSISLEIDREAVSPL